MSFAKDRTTKRMISKRNKNKQKNHTGWPKQCWSSFGPSALHFFIGSAFGVGGVQVLIVVVDACDGPRTGVVCCHGSHLRNGATFIFGHTNMTTWFVCSHWVYKHP
jgi:hypothetical protein